MQFRTKARAVDLLGKGQIADLPTAITELWKNGYDAYADNLTAEIYLDTYKDLKSSLFLMTDDGKGMSHSDILDKWLVLGTDSKSRTEIKDEEGIETLWKKPRVKTGEKGIGRLSVAFLGTPMLMLTKKTGEPLQALFFDWRLIENYNLFLDEVNIPVKDVNSINEFRDIFSQLKKKFLDNFKENNEEISKWEEQKKLKNKIIKSVESIEIPSFFENEILSNIIDIKEHHGTKFIIFEPINQITQMTKKDEDDLDDKEFLIKSLSGFTNSFIKNNKLVNTSIPVHEKVGFDYDLLTSKGEFYTQKDFNLGDVYIKGNFDGKGNFTGKIRMYDETIDYQLNNPRKQNKSSEYGVFPIEFGYSMGLEKSTFLEKKDFDFIRKKIENKGGAIYIYRDNFRVLPYGRTDWDFLEFERRRALHAGDYFWSHQRMFGYIGLTREFNGRLRDKTSREGLINNIAYRAFKNDLVYFFEQTAKEFFATKPKQDIFKDKKKELNDKAEEIKKDRARIKKDEREFKNQIKEYPNKFENYQKEYNTLINELSNKIHESDFLFSSIEDILKRLKELEISFKDLIPKIPKHFELKDAQLDTIDKYTVQAQSFIDTTKKESEEIINKAKDKLELKELVKDYTKTYKTYETNLRKIEANNRNELSNRFRFLLDEYDKKAKNIIKPFLKDEKELFKSIKDKKRLFTESERLQNQFETIREKLEKELIPMVEHINRVSFDIDESLVQGAYLEEYEMMKNEWELTRDTAQIGIAVEIIDHEFEHLYSSINQSIKKLNKYDLFTDVNEFNYLSNNFKQLEEKYQLLAPLYRISGSIEKNIECEDIYKYLIKFFESKIKSQNVNFEMTESFINHKIFIKKPVIFTVFINVINNALYWMRNTKEKRIEFDYNNATEEIIIKNSGKRIEEHKLDKIFKLFYSNKPNGRGLGLYLSKQSLNENYFDLYATNDKKYNTLKGACFVIKPVK